MDVSSAMSTIILLVTATLIFGTVILITKGSAIFGQGQYTEANSQRLENALIAVSQSDSAQLEVKINNQTFRMTDGTAQIIYKQKNQGKQVTLPNKQYLTYQQQGDGRINVEKGLCITKNSQQITFSQGC